MNITKRQREAIRDMFGGRCAYCGIVLAGKWHVDHVEPVIRETKYEQSGYVDGEWRKGGYKATGKYRAPENQRLDNLFPACIPCNIDKSDNSLEVRRTWLQERITHGLRRNSATFRHAERFGRVKLEEGPLVFWFEKSREEVA